MDSNFTDESTQAGCLPPGAASLLQFVCHLAEFIVPFLTETADERVAKEHVDGEMKLTAFLHCRLADVPPMVLKPHKAVRKGFLAYGIHGTGDGLAPSRTAFPEGLVRGTITAAVCTIAGEHAVLTIDNAGHEVAFAVRISHTLCVNETLRLGTQVGPYFIEHPFKLDHFIQVQGGTAVAFHAALALACIKVAAEAFGEYFGGEDDIANLYEGRIRIHSFMG